MERENIVTGITRLSLSRRVTVFVVFLTIITVGFISTKKLPLELNPKGNTYPKMSVMVHWNTGIPPESMDKIGLPLEEEISTVRGLDSITTHGYKWGSRIDLRFKPGTDMDIAYREVSDRTDRARLHFPKDAQPPRIRKYKPGSEPVARFRISYDENTDFYTLLQKHVAIPLHRIDGVADVHYSVQPREIKINVDKDKVEAYGLNIRQISQKLRSDNFTLTSGMVVDGGKKYTLKSLNSFHTLEQMKNIPLTENIFLKDIASITYEASYNEIKFRFNGQPMVHASVIKESEANTIEVARKTVETITRIKQNPALASYEIEVYHDIGEDISNRLNNLIYNGLYGAILAALVLYFFLQRFRTTMVIAAAIPICLLVSLTSIYFADQTLNKLTILGLVICVGLLVDNSVVVAENIHRHHLNGASRMDACLRGVGEIGFAITTATLTTLIVFFSPMLTDGSLRYIFSKLALPVITALIASLVAALVFIPLCVYLTLSAKNSPRNRDKTGPFASGFHLLFTRLYNATFGQLNIAYNTALRFFIKRRIDLSFIMIILLAASYFIGFKNLNFSDHEEEVIREFYMNVYFPRKTSMPDKLAYFKEVEKIMDTKKAEYGLKSYQVRYNMWHGQDGFTGFFAPDRVSKYSREEAIDKIYDDFPKQAGIRIRYRGRGGDENKDNHKFKHYIRLVGDDPDLLKEVAKNLKPNFEILPGVISFLDSNPKEGPSEMALVIDRKKANSLGVNPQTMAGTISAAIRGSNLPRFNNNGRQIPVRLLFDEEDRSELDDIYNFMVPAEEGRFSTVGAITKTSFLKREDDAITRHDKKVSEWFGMKLQSDPDSWKIKRNIEETKKNINLPEGVSFDERKKTFDDRDQAMGSLIIGLAILFVFMLVAFFFESLLMPFSIILTVPLAAMGAIWLLYITETSIDKMGYIGACLLVGIVVNNGIVLVDYTNQLRQSGMQRTESLLQAAQDRFRPIVMTALTTICGMLPLTIGSGNEMDTIFRCFGMILIGGMTSATLFTLLAVPVFYTLIEDAQRALSNTLASIFDL